MKSLVILFAVLFLAGCTSKRTEKKNNFFEVVDITKAVKNKGEVVYLSDYAKNIEYIFLETKEECLLGSVEKVTIDDTLVFVNNREQLLVFNIEGKFLRNIAKKGGGPGEYSGITDFSVNRTDDKIYICDSGLGKIFVYNYNGEFDFEFNFDSRPSKVACINDKYIVLVHSGTMYLLNDNFYLSYYSLDGKLINKNFKGKVNNVAQGPSSTTMVRFQNYCDSLTFWEINQDTIYRSSELGEVTARYKIESVGNEENTPVAGGVVAQNIFRYSHFLETENLLFFVRGALNNNVRQIMYDKNNHTAKSMEIEEGDLSFKLKHGCFTNDFDGGMPFLPFDILHDGRLYNTFFPVELSNFLKERNKTDHQIKYPDRYSALQKKLQDSGENGNPVIMLVTF